MRIYTHYPSKRKGFTLIELMITVTIIGILAAIALPSYTKYIQRSHRSNARNALIQAAQWMERAATATGAYPQASSLPASAANAASLGNISAAILNVDGGRYTISITVSTGNAYAFIATPMGAQVGEICGTLRLDQANTRDTVARTPEQTARESDINCWSR